ncbi:hypothetical protein RCL1_004066 [Eukaryota sp. TZLM3-RCL]
MIAELFINCHLSLHMKTFLGLLFVLIVATAQIRQASVLLTKGEIKIVDQTWCPGATTLVIATGTFNSTLHSKGWGYLNIETNPGFDDDQIMYAAGLLQGYLTHVEIAQFHRNMWIQTFTNAKTPVPLEKYLIEQDQWQRAMVERNPTDPFWYQLGLTRKQFDGVLDGYNMVSDFPLSKVDLLVQTSDGDLYELLPALNITTMPSTLTDILEAQSCSALIKILPDKSDILASHVTFTKYWAMLRLHVTMNLQGLDPKYTKTTRFSYTTKPGYLYSKDDAYITGSGLWITETTISVHNEKLLSNVHPRTVLTWARAMIAARGSNTPKGWTDLFKQYNSGTYCNQWYVLILFH